MPLWAEFTIYALAIILAVIHCGQSVVFFGALPGDLADARLGNCILEHVYRAISGHAKLFSPAQFYPTKGTLVYSDNHFGTVFLYALFRLGGAGMATAFKGWLLTIMAANTMSLIFLLRSLRIHPLISAPLAFFGTASFALVLKTGHPQVLPFFPMIIALTFFFRFLREGCSRQLGWVAIWLAYQHACYMYHGYFALIIFSTLFIIFIFLGCRPGWGVAVLKSARANWRFLLITFAATGYFLFWLYKPYVRFSAGMGTRSMEELVALAPNPGAWFSASPFSAFYSNQTFYKANANMGENTLFAGWMIWLLLLGALTAAFRAARSSQLRFAGILTLASFLVIAALTSWGDSGWNLYLMIARQVSSIRAFRSFTRIAYPLLALQAVAGAIFLDVIFRKAKSQAFRTLTVGLAFALMTESLSLGSIHYSPKVARDRAKAIMRGWRRAGSHDVLVFAPGYTNQSNEVLHIDCWQAALMMEKYTVNGYSGNQPPRYQAFLNSPTVENAEELLAGIHLDPRKVSLVRSWNETDKARLGLVSYQFLPSVTITAASETIRMMPLSIAELPVVVKSVEKSDLNYQAFHAFASYRLFDAAGLPVNGPPSLRTVIKRISPNGTETRMNIQAPAQSGRYEARLSMVHEGVAWWADLGYPGSTVNIVVP